MTGGGFPAAFAQTEMIFMRRIIALVSALILLLAGCGTAAPAASDAPSVPDGTPPIPTAGTAYDVTPGRQTERGFVLDNVLHSDEGDIHFNLYTPDSYDGSEPYALFVTLAGYEGLYFQGVGANLSEDFGFTAQSYNPDMLVVAPQLSDWGDTSARQTVALVEYFLDAYNIDPARVYLHGMSGGGETASLVMGLRPELFAACLVTSTRWDGDLNVLAGARTPVYMAIGAQDSYYGAEPLTSAYNELRAIYESLGLPDAEIDSLAVLDVREQEFFTSHGFSDQHAGGQAFAHDETVMGWLFSHERDTVIPMEYTERRAGTSVTTLATPDDWPEEYNYGDGLSQNWTGGMNNLHLPEPEGNATVMNTAPDPTQIQALYLWEEGNVPAVTEFTPDMNGYFDEYDFRPYVTAIPVREGVTPRGAVVLLAGGAFMFRGNYTDALPTAAHLRELGFQTFIVDYRLRPYTQQEGALDVARAVRFIRANADVYGIDGDDISVMGFSAGGIQAGEFLLNFDGDVQPTALDSDYVPDELDTVPAYASAAGMIYSFYGRLSVASMDEAELRAGTLPPTFYCYGTRDPFYDQFEAQYELMQEIGVPTRRIVLEGWPHGFGGDGDWIEDYAAWLDGVFADN